MNTSTLKAILMRWNDKNKKNDSYLDDATNRRRIEVSEYYVPPAPIPHVQPGSYRCENPSEHDVLCGRGSRINQHKGNIEFRQLVAQFRDIYIDPSCRKVEKAHICAYLVAIVREVRGGRFLKYSPKYSKWEEVGDVKARQKAGQALRENAPGLRSLGTEKCSSTKCHDQSRNEIIKTVDRKNFKACRKKSKTNERLPCDEKSEDHGEDCMEEDELLRASIESFRLSVESGNICSSIDFAQFLKDGDRDILQNSRLDLDQTEANMENMGAPTSSGPNLDSLSSSDRTLEVQNISPFPATDCRYCPSELIRGDDWEGASRPAASLIQNMTHDSTPSGPSLEKSSTKSSSLALSMSRPTSEEFCTKDERMECTNTYLATMSHSPGIQNMDNPAYIDRESTRGAYYSYNVTPDDLHLKRRLRLPSNHENVRASLNSSVNQRFLQRSCSMLAAPTFSRRP